ncbi:TBC1 domain family member 8B [Dirofilaria immitis]
MDSGNYIDVLDAIRNRNKVPLQNYFTNGLFHDFDENGVGLVDFKEFVCGFSGFLSWAAYLLVLIVN